MRIPSSVLRATVAVLTTALIPAVAAAQEPEEVGKQATTVGITVTVKADAWSGQPVELTEVIPLLVTIENNSRVPIRLRYAEFTLAGNGERAPALPPFEITGTETEVVGTAGVLNGPYPFPLTGFYVAPHSSRFYPRLRVFAGPFAYDPLFYSTYYPAFRRLRLPTGDMVQKALPEGVLEAGGKVTGFLYFEDIDVGADDTATFTTDLVNASTGQTVGAIRIPLEID
jgi:hypothetical protein